MILNALKEWVFDFVTSPLGWAAILAWVAVLLCGCSTKGIPTPSEILDRNQQIQDCILSGGHPHAGPSNTIICT